MSAIRRLLHKFSDLFLNAQKKSEEIHNEHSRSTYIYYSLPYQLIEEFFARLLEHIDNEIKSLASLVIWVGNIGVVACVGSKVVAHTVHLVDIVTTWGQATNALVVTIVHYDNAIKVAEVIHAEWSRAVSKAVATTMCSLAHTRIGKFACVSRVCSCRVNLELIAQTTGKDLLTENLLRHR